MQTGFNGPIASSSLGTVSLGGFLHYGQVDIDGTNQNMGVSVGAYDTDDTAEAKDTPAEAHLEGLDALARQDEPTLIVLPDLSGLSPTTSENEDEVKSVRADYHRVLIQALAQCAELGDRFLIADLWQTDQSTGREGLEAFRNGIGTRNLAYGAIYHPFLHTTLPWRWDEQTIRVKHHPPDEEGTSTDRLASLRSDGTTTYAAVRRILDRYTVTLPPSAAVAGVYASVDRNRGVWKAPANESLASVRGLAVEIDHALNADMNVDTRGKSINALRFFAGKGVLVWGARTLAGNDNEWRYVPVRRFFIMAEESIKKATEPFVFEPNDANTWARVRAMIESFLTLQWRQGALAGAVPADAFYVKAGLGETMTAQDILEGRMNVEIGLAALRPAEFIILRFSHKMQES